MMPLYWEVWVSVWMSWLGHRRYSKGGIVAHQKPLRKSHWIGIESNCDAVGLKSYSISTSTINIVFFSF